MRCGNGGPRHGADGARAGVGRETTGQAAARRHLTGARWAPRRDSTEAGHRSGRRGAQENPHAMAPRQAKGRHRGAQGAQRAATTHRRDGQLHSTTASGRSSRRRGQRGSKVRPPHTNNNQAPRATDRHDTHPRQEPRTPAMVPATCQETTTAPSQGSDLPKSPTHKQPQTDQHPAPATGH